MSSDIRDPHHTVRMQAYPPGGALSTPHPSAALSSAMVQPQVFRQGDVLFASVGTLLDDGSTVGEMPTDTAPANTSIIARGESSGHCHAVRGHRDQLRVKGESLWVDTRTGAVHIDHTHESSLLQLSPPVADHQPLVLPEGYQWLVIIEEDYTPEGTRYVED